MQCDNIRVSLFSSYIVGDVILSADKIALFFVPVCVGIWELNTYGCKSYLSRTQNCKHGLYTANCKML